MMNSNSVNLLLNKIKFDPTINLGHIISLVAFLVMGIAGWYQLKGEIAVNQTENVLRLAIIDKTILEHKLNQKEKDIEQDRQMQLLAGELKYELRSNRDELRQEFKDLRSDIRKR